MSLTWASIRDGWSTNWTALQDEAMATYGSSVVARPSDYADRATGTIRNLQAVAIDLVAIDAMMAANPKVVAAADRADLTALRRRYQDLGAGVFAEAASMGAAPAAGVVLIVLGVGLTVAALAWAIVAYPYTTNLREQTELKRRELEERVKASEDGRYLQSSTIPADVPAIDLSNKGDGIGGGTIALGVAAVLGLVGLVAWRR